jgi:hypothetical protein
MAMWTATSQATGGIYTSYYCDSIGSGGKVCFTLQNIDMFACGNSTCDIEFSLNLDTDRYAVSGEVECDFRFERGGQYKSHKVKVPFLFKNGIGRFLVDFKIRERSYPFRNVDR